MEISDSEYGELKRRLSGFAFRSRFHLSDKEKQYVYFRGMEEIRGQAENIVSRRLVNPANDGKQTPMRGHAVFTAQHATATCCRGCISKWHNISSTADLSSSDIAYIVSVIIRFIEDEMIDYHPEDYGQLMLFQ